MTGYTELFRLVVRLDCVRDNDFPREARFAFVVEHLDLLRCVFIAELIHYLGRGHCEFTEEYSRAILTVHVKIELTEAWIIAMNHVVEVLVDQHNCRTEDNQ